MSSNEIRLRRLELVASTRPASPCPVCYDAGPPVAFFDLHEGAARPAPPRCPGCGRAPFLSIVTYRPESSDHEQV